jgi:hypothetical protein
MPEWGTPAVLLFEAHRDLKSKVMCAAEEIGGVKYCAQVTLHDLARHQEHDDLVLWGANTVLGRFNLSLRGSRSVWVCIARQDPSAPPIDI